MMALLDTNEAASVCEAEMGCPVGQLLTPLTRFTLRDPSRPWAIDNGAFSNFNPKAFLSLLERESHHKTDCLFVALPDMVGAAQRTLELFKLWKPRLQGWKVALVCQDGLETLPIPWDDLDAVFIGGSTAWKVSGHAANIITAAQVHFGKWVHVGRVNDPNRWKHFEDLGADSCDGTGLARYTHMREAIADRHSSTQGSLLCPT